MHGASKDRVEQLKAVRRIADLAFDDGISTAHVVRRATYSHVGALIADAVLQAGLNYRTVVLPRIGRILNAYPELDRVSEVVVQIDRGRTAQILNWEHRVKIERFECLARFLYTECVDTHHDLRRVLQCDDFCLKLLSLNGVGPKTVDYMACLVGIESIPVDRHIKSYAAKAGVPSGNYVFLKNVFCYAADLLSVSRREFDAWIWSRESLTTSVQMSLAFEESSMDEHFQQVEA